MKSTIAVIAITLALAGSAWAQEDCSDHDFYWHNGHHRGQHQCNSQKPLPTVPHAQHELTAADYANLAAYLKVEKERMKNPDSFSVKRAFYLYLGPRSDAEKEADRARIARACAKITIREDNVSKCTDKEFARFEDAYTTYANKWAFLDNIQFCIVYKATNSYGGFIEESTCPSVDWADPSQQWHVGSWTEVPPEPAPPALTPMEQAKQAQQYADCLKAAVDNPSIVCK